MNILLIFPRVKYAPAEMKKDKEFIQKLFGEPVSLTLPQVAGATPAQHSIRIVDENYENIDFTNVSDIDLIGITCLTMSAPRAYEIADRFREIKIPVVLGGNHSTALPHEAKQHADSVVVGEAEITWPQLLSDFERGQLKPFYVSKKAVPSESIPEPRRDLIRRKYYSDGLLIKRGCPNRCEFCFITSHYRKEMRPIENVLKEIAKISADRICIYDQNITWQMKYTKDLLKELKKFNKRWLANGTIDILGKNDDFLKLAKDAGFFYWYIGFESISQKSLNGINKKHNRVEEFASAIKKIKSYGMVMVGSFIFGFDEDASDIFDNTLQALDDWNIYLAEFHILTPYPGTVLYSRLKKEGRILTEDWSKYNTANVVFQPKNMTVNELFMGTRKIAKEFYTFPRIIKRFYNTLEETNNLYVSYYVLQRNLQYRERYKNQFNF